MSRLTPEEWASRAADRAHQLDQLVRLVALLRAQVDTLQARVAKLERRAEADLP
jgi:ubiquinone biosynthesis protein UbiJ